MDPQAVKLRRDDLVQWIEAGCKPPERWRVGTEHEKFGFRLADLAPLPYAGEGDRASIRDVLQGLVDLGWQGVEEEGALIALRKGAESVTLEPGGQLELSGAPVESVHETCREVTTHLRQVKSLATDLGVGFVGLGFNPRHTLAEIPVMPKARYGVMRRYMPRVGGRGLDMMFRTATVQANLDFSSEADMVKKLRVSLALQPVATALFANSPFCEGAPAADERGGFLSLRSHVWMDTDSDRCGTLPWVWDDGMGFARYVDWALDAPMYFMLRDGRYVDATATRTTFRDFMDGRFEALPGETPRMADWDLHLTTLFPEVRLKRFLEMRGADGGPWSSLCALPALWVGLLYDPVALDAAWDLVKGWEPADRDHLRVEVPRTALRTTHRGGTVRDLAERVLEIATEGLRRRGRLDHRGRDENHHLDPLREVAESGVTPAEDHLASFHGPWNGSVKPLFDELAY